MSVVKIEVEISEGMVKLISPDALPAYGRGILTVVTSSSAPKGSGFTVLNSETDGLPLIRGERGVITTALVREIENAAQ